jgi:succinoglycan biosynthesis transport protein ExoP
MACSATPKFTVATDIMIDPANLQVVSDDLFQQPGQAMRAAQRRQQAARVDLGQCAVARRRRAQSRRTTRSSTILDAGLLALGPDPVRRRQGRRPNPRLAALAALTKKVTTKADEKSFVATLLVSSEAAPKSIRIAEAIVAAFQDRTGDGRVGRRLARRPTP